MYYSKRNPTTITYYGTKMKSEADPPPCNRLSQPHPGHSNQGHPICEAYPDKEVPNKTVNKISRHRKCLCVFETMVDICCKGVL
jgi:hypothetical protein